MDIKKLLAAAVLSLPCMHAFAQVTFSSLTSGTFSGDTAIGGVLSATAGTPYTLEVTSVFPETVSWIDWPNWMAQTAAQSTARLTIDGVTHEYGGTAQMQLRMADQPAGDSTGREVVYIVSLGVTNTQAGFSFSNHFHLAPESGGVSLFDLFASGQSYPVSAEAANTASMWLAPAGQYNAFRLNTSVSSVSYSTSGVPVTSAVPEPSAAAMLLAGLALLGVGARRSRR